MEKAKLTLWDIDDFDIDTGGNENVEDINMAEMEENFYKGYKGSEFNREKNAAYKNKKY